MKKNKLNIFLILFFILIWGGVINKFFIKKSILKEEEKFQLNYATNFSSPKDTFLLELTNLNPFKIKQGIRKPLKTKQVFKKKKINYKVNPKEKKNIFQYFGYVKANTSQSKLVLISVNGTLYRKREMDNIDNVTILIAYGDSLIIRDGNQNRTINKQ
jgi:hypothetical protein